MRQNGFSLVELSIVLVILGLLTGGILTGQSLIRAAELRSVTTEFQAYQTAVMTFRDKYFALPGDMTNATEFWGAADSSGSGGECGDPDTDTGTGTQTCNGNGDGLISHPTIAPINERFRFWQHLANAGLIEGSFSGVSGAGHATKHSVVGENVPASRLSGAGWTARHVRDSDTLPGTGTAFAISYGNIMQLGGQSAADATGEPIVTPQEMWSIDQKIDDSKPAIGKLVTEYPDCTNAASATELDADYNLSNESAACYLVFRNTP